LLNGPSIIPAEESIDRVEKDEIPAAATLEKSPAVPVSLAEVALSEDAAPGEEEVHPAPVAGAVGLSGVASAAHEQVAGNGISGEKGEHVAEGTVPVLAVDVPAAEVQLDSTPSASEPPAESESIKEDLSISKGLVAESGVSAPTLANDSVHPPVFDPSVESVPARVPVDTLEDLVNEPTPIVAEDIPPVTSTLEEAHPLLAPEEVASASSAVETTEPVASLPVSAGEIAAPVSQSEETTPESLSPFPAAELIAIPAVAALPVSAAGAGTIEGPGIAATAESAAVEPVAEADASSGAPLEDATLTDSVKSPIPANTEDLTKNLAGAEAIDGPASAESVIEHPEAVAEKSISAAESATLLEEVASSAPPTAEADHIEEKDAAQIGAASVGAATFAVVGSIAAKHAKSSIEPKFNGADEKTAALLSDVEVIPSTDKTSARGEHATEFCGLATTC
jgi:hypothetical protein